MMRYRDAQQYRDIENAIRTQTSRYSLKTHLASDNAYASKLWDSICVYMIACDFGIAVFEEIDTRNFNPNISIELGFMFALGKECLLLKDKRMPNLPTDFCGHLYKQFDTYKIHDSINQQIASWVSELRNRGML